MELLIFLATPAQSPVNVSIPEFNPVLILTRLLTIVPLIGGYMLAREGRGKLLWEVSAVLLLVLATVTITATNITVESLPTILNAILNRLPVALLLLGLAFVRDGGFKMIVGLLLMVVSGLLLPRTM